LAATIPANIASLIENEAISTASATRFGTAVSVCLAIFLTLGAVVVPVILPLNFRDPPLVIRVNGIK
jgi:hypothetical protein